MTAGKPETPASTPLGGTTADLAIRLGLLGLVGYWSFTVIAPFLTIVLWSAVLTVALYPLFDWFAGRLRRPRLAAVLITLLSLMIVIGPVTWLAFGLIGGVGSLARQLDAGMLSVPLPADTGEGLATGRRTSPSVVEPRCNQHEGGARGGGATPAANRGQAARHRRERRAGPSAVHGLNRRRRFPVLSGAAAAGCRKGAAAAGAQPSRRRDGPAGRHDHTQRITRCDRHRAASINPRRRGLPGCRH